ncbi:MAG TPA: AI-2E family transporter [Candidatus Pristimantibacillus sp.]|jgi:predicted PurR-regulated permease PerM|nr:AI-2E family transporter [Candidatus Pristimantibacillus sp.]
MMFRSKSKDKNDVMDINIPNRVVVRVMLVVVATLIGLAAVKQAGHALVLIFTAFFLSVALNAPVHWVAQRLPGKRKGSRAAATAISFLVVVALLVAFVVSIVPPLVDQTSNFIGRIPELSRQVHDKDSGIGRLVARYDLQDDINKFSSQLSDRLGNVSGAAVTGVQKFGSSVFALLTVLVLTFMMLIEGPRWKAFLMDLVPDERQARVERLTGDMYRVVKGYVNGQVVLALIASVMLLPGLLILHVPYAAALVVVVFICGLIPLVGHTIGAIIVTLVALFQSPLSAVLILAYYILYQQIENYIIQPRIQANSTNMSPLLVFSAVIIGVSFGGLLGGLVAIPVAGCIRIALLDYLRSKKIIEPSTFKAAVEEKKSI